MNISWSQKEKTSDATWSSLMITWHYNYELIQKLISPITLSLNRQIDDISMLILSLFMNVDTRRLGISNTSSIRQIKINRDIEDDTIFLENHIADFDPHSLFIFLDQIYDYTTRTSSPIDKITFEILSMRQQWIIARNAYHQRSYQESWYFVNEEQRSTRRPRESDIFRVICVLCVFLV